MMKCEFDALIGKESDVKAYAEIYEPMYLALPEYITKAEFVAMLNIDTIKESAESIARKKERAELIERVEREINERKATLKDYKASLESAKESLEYWKEQNDTEMIQYLKREIVYYKRLVTLERIEIENLKLIIE